MLKISLQRLPESHFGSRPQKRSKSASRSFLRAISGAAGRHKPGNPWFEQLLPRKHEVFHDLTNFTQKNSRIFAGVALICQLYEGNLRVTWISLAFLQASLHPGGATWLLLAGGGAPRPGNPWFEQLYTEKLEDFRQSNINLSTLRKELEADIHSDPIFTSKVCSPAARPR